MEKVQDGVKRGGMLYWITGLSGAGKTTIGNRLYYELKRQQENVVLLDGDILKNIVGDDLGYSETDRRKRAMRYASICKLLTSQGMVVICCTIAMYDAVREWNRKNNKGYIEVFLDVPDDVLHQRDQKGMYSQYKKGEFKNLAGVDVKVEFPKHPDLIICNDGHLTVRECVEQILNVKTKFYTNFDRDVEYWNKYYEESHDIEKPSLFAESVIGLMTENRNLLELGCGNGRDSLYFIRHGINVTGIDASDTAIKRLHAANSYGNAYFICDDFVCSSTIFVEQFDYCYSRFSLHAINAEQESEVIKNIYRALKKGGRFFIEVRSVNDDIYGLGEKIAEDTYVYEGHFRRFVVKDELEHKLEQAGFCISYSEEKRGFAPYGESNPPIIRIIAEKNNIDDGGNVSGNR